MSHARIEMCPECKKHGRIVLAHDFVGLEFCFQRHALTLIQHGVEEFENISPQDGEKLAQTIQTSSLPLEWYMIPLTYHWLIERWNQFRVASGDFHQLGPHGFLQQSVDAHSISSDFRSNLQNAYPT